MEQWKGIPGTDYSVSSEGRVGSGIPNAALKRVKDVGLRDYWTAPHAGGKP